MKRAWAGRAAFVLGEVALLLAVPVLAWKGFSAVLDTTEGRVVDPELDPHEPGYEAFVESTPTLAVLGSAPDGTLSWATVVALSGAEGRGGSVIFVPIATVVPAAGGVRVEVTLAERFAEDGFLAAGQAVSDLLGVGMSEVIALDGERLGQLVEPVAPLAIANPDAAGGFVVGELELAAADSAAYLAAAADGESDLTRLARHEVFWRAWLAAVSQSTDPDAVPGETTSGIGRFVRGVAAGPVTFDVPPVQAEEGEDGSVRFRADPVATVDLAEERIPFPAAPYPGGRARVRVLDGVGADALTLRASRDVIQAGGQVVVIGNADRFDATTSRVVYFDPSAADAADRIAAAFGVTAERLDGPNPDDRVDVSVVAGADLLAAYGLSARTITIGDDAG